MLMLVTFLEPNTKPLEVKLKVDTLDNGFVCTVFMLARPEPVSFIDKRAFQ